LNIWLVTIGEPVPLEADGRDRLHRTGYFARFLAGHGHEVTWWTSTFDHFRKIHHFEEDRELCPRQGLTIRLLHSPGYSRNVSPGRVMDHRRVARAFARAAPASSPPDVIVAAWPTPGLAAAAVQYARPRGIPVVLDMRDMWPDIFVSVLPGPVQRLIRPFVRIYRRRLHQTCAGAAAVTGITEAFVEWGLGLARRQKEPFDRRFPMGYESSPIDPDLLVGADAFWDRAGIVRKPGEIVACFFGTIGRQFDLGTVVRAAEILRTRQVPVRFVICGTGDRLPFYKRLAGRNPLIVFPGWIDRAQIYALMRRSTVGLDPMIDRYDFLATINNKAIEYLSAGLPILSSPERGVLHELLTSQDCGLTYPRGDPERLADRLTFLARNPARRAVLAANAAHLFEVRFRAEKVYGEFEHYLADIEDAWKSGSMIRGGPAR